MMCTKIQDTRYGATPMSPPGGRSAGPRASTGSTQATDVDYIPSHSVPAGDGYSRVTGRKRVERKKNKGPPKGKGSRKRARTDDGFSSFENSDPDEAWPRIPKVSRPVEEDDSILTPRYLVVESDTPDKPLTKCNIFAIKKWFLGISSMLQGKIRKMAGGGFLVECPNSRVAKLLLRRNGCEFISLKIKVSAHRSLNSSKGVIWCPDLEGYDDAEILDDIKNKGVTQVERCFKKRGGLRVPTHTFFVTFCKPTLPESLYVGFSNVKVSPFIPKPLQCYTCYGFGHPSMKCRKKDNPICGRCGHEAHEDKCSQAAHCPNCKGGHGPTSKDCPKYKKEALIKKIMSQKKIPFKEARIEAEREIEDSVPQKGKSFADAAASAIGKQRSSPILFTPKVSKQFQCGAVLPESVRAEAVALGNDLKEQLKSKSSKSKAQTPRPITQSQANSRARGQASRASKPAPVTSKAKPGESSALSSRAAGKESGLKEAAPLSSNSNLEEMIPASAHQAAGGVHNSNTEESQLSFGFGSPVKAVKEKAGDNKVVFFSGGTGATPGSTPKEKVEPTKAVLAAAKLNFKADKYKLSYSRAIRGANTVSSASQGSSSPGKEKSTKLVPYRPKSPPKQSSFVSSNRFASLQEEESDQGDFTEDDDSNDDMEYVSS